MSSAASIQLIGVRPDDGFAPHVDYVLRLFARNCGMVLGTGTADDTETALTSLPEPRVLLFYDSTEAAEALIAKTAGQYEAVLVVKRSSFFGEKFLESPDLPARAENLLAAATGKLDEYVTSSGDRVLRISLDLIASAFWFLTRYEEYLISSHDEHGRFLSTNSMATAEMYDVPVVNRWFQEMYVRIRQLLQLPKESAQGRHTIALTHDVDRMRKYRGLRGARAALKSMAQGTVTEASGEIRHATLVLAGIRRDPYDSFDDLFTLKERIGAPSTFFFMGGGKTGWDSDYRLDEPHVRTLITRVKSFGDELAFHPSYASYRSQSAMASEMSAVSQAGARIVHGARTHYLRFAVPETWRTLAATNIRYDSSMSFADRAGFRCGWSGCFHPFDIENKIELQIIEIPLVVMDVTLSLYEKVSAEHSLERLATLLEASDTRGGAFVFLWHNTIRDRRVHSAFWDTFEYFFFAAAGSARFVTLSRLCDEFEKSK